MTNDKFEIIDERTKQNINSLNIETGLLKGEFQGVRYFLKARPGNFIESVTLINGIWEPHIAEILSANIRSDCIVIDIGANIGASTIPLAKKFPDSFFYLFEPHPEVFLDLKENVILNRLENIRLFNNAVSNANKKIDFYAQKSISGEINMGLSSSKLNNDIGDYQKIVVDSIRLDDLFEKQDKVVGIIKIDTQGNEIEVLKSAYNLILKDRPIIIFEFETEYFTDEEERLKNTEFILDFFNELRYKIFAIQPKSNYFPTVNLKGYFNGDILAIPVTQL